MRSRATMSPTQVGSNGLLRGFELPSTRLGTFIRNSFAECSPTSTPRLNGPVARKKPESALSAAAERVLVAVSEPRLKALCLRLPERSLPEREWVESVGSLLCSKPPAKWLDADVAMFRDELARLARQFRRVESTVFTGGSTDRGHAMRSGHYLRGWHRGQNRWYTWRERRTRKQPKSNQLLRTFSSRRAALGWPRLPGACGIA